MTADDRCAQRDLTGARCTFQGGHTPEGLHRFSTLEPKEATDVAAALTEWWRRRSEAEIEQTVSKAVEYSGTLGGLPADLVDFGRQIAFVQRREHDFADAELAEIGVWAYVVGKVNRWSSALRNGQAVSDDTLLDIGVYIRMAQRIRDAQQWP